MQTFSTLVFNVTQLNIFNLQRNATSSKKIN